MPPIRKGDGTAVTPKGISQVRTGDGRIFFDGPAIPDGLVDNFEQSDEVDGSTEPFGPYGEGEGLDTYYSGDFNRYDITTNGPVSGDAFEGDRLLVGTGDSQERIISKPGDGLPNYFEDGRVASCLVHIDDDNTDDNLQVLFAVQDINNFLGVDVNAFNQNVTIFETVNGSQNVLDSESLSIDSSDFFDVEMDRSGSNLVARIFDYDPFEAERGSELRTLEVSNPPFSDESGIGFQHSGPSGNIGVESRFFDFYRLVD